MFWTMLSTLNQGLVDGSDITCGQVTVVTSGTRVQVSATPLLLRGGVFFREKDTSCVFYIGKDDVTTSNGFYMTQNNPAWIECKDLSDLWIDCDVNNKTLSYMAF